MACSRLKFTFTLPLIDGGSGQLQIYPGKGAHNTHWPQQGLTNMRLSFSFFWRDSPPVGQGLLIHDVSRSHNDEPQSVGLSGRVISPSQRPLPDNTRYPQQTDIHDPGAIRTHNVSRRVAADLRLRSRGHLDLQQFPSPFSMYA